MSRDLTDVLQEFVTEQAQASADSAPDLSQRARTIAALAGRRRAQRVGGFAAASVALVAAGVVAASALTGPPPQPADPQPSVSATPSPSPTVTSGPSPTPSVPSRALVPGMPDSSAPWVRGVVPSLASAPRALWTVAPADVAGDWPWEEAPLFGDVAEGAVQPGAQVVDAGDTIVAYVADLSTAHARVVGLDAATGQVRWARGASGTPALFSCAGVSPDLLVVCAGASDGKVQLQLLAPGTGEVVRAYPVPLEIASFAVVGSLAVVHGTVGDDAAWTGVDVRTGEVVWSHVAPDRVTPYTEGGDPVAETLIAWPYARLLGVVYAATIDVRTGQEVDPPTGPGLIGDLGVWAPADPVSAPVLDSWRRDEQGDVVSVVSDRVRALDPRDGSLRWTYEAADVSPVALVGDVVVVGTQGGTVSGLDATSGQVLWSSMASGHAVATDGELLLLSSGTVLRLVDGAVVREEGATVGRLPLGLPGRLVSENGEGLSLSAW